LQYVSSGLMRGIWQEGKIVFFDTLRHWPASVANMGKAIGLPKLEMPHLGCDCDDCITYCQRDTEITYLFVDEMLARYEDLGLDKIRSTLPSMALQLWKKFYRKELPQMSDYQRQFFQKGYYGGRVEVYRMGEIKGITNHYDINSLFPSVMKDFSYPDLESLHQTTKPNFENEGIFEGWVYVPETKFPCLPVRAEEIVFPYGNLYGTWCYPELRQLLEDGGQVVACKEAFEFDEVENPFDKYVDFCYGKRLEAQSELDKTFWKLMLNSLYGKFGQSRGLTVIHNDEEKTIGGVAKHANVIWSAYVTSYARLRLLGYLRSCTDCYYTDTDSLFTPDDIQTSLELGDIKKEGQYSSVNFKGNKLYCVDEFTKAKGVPRKVAGDFFRTGKAVYRKPNRFRESRRRGLTPNVWNEVEKTSNKTYTKRKVLENGLTEPWNFLEYTTLIKRDML